MSLSWSYSAYSTAVQCLRKYKLCYVDKAAPDYESSDLVFGSALHSAINSILLGQDGAQVFEIYWSSYQNKEIQYGRHSWKDLARLGAEFCRKFTKLHASRYKLETAEKRLSANYKGIKLEGTLDFFGEYDGKASLRDFKTSGSNYAKEKALIALQLNLYAYLYKENFGKTPETLGYTVFNKATGSIQDLTWTFSEATMVKALDELYDYVNVITQPDLCEPAYPRNLNACLDYNRKCPYWSKCHE